MPSTGMRTMADELDEAVTRAREHLLSAWAEGVEAARALFEAAGIATERTGPTAGRTTRSSAAHETDPLRAGLDDLVGALRRAGLLQPPPSMMQSLSEALEHEIRRWEARSRTDPEARLVLRAFLVLRELSWELGTSHRRSEGDEAAARTDAAARPTSGETASPRPAARQRAQRRPRPSREPSATGARMPRVQRFEVEQG